MAVGAERLPAPQRFSTFICYERYEQKIIESPRPVFFRRRSVGARATGPTAGGANRAARRDPYPRPVYPAVAGDSTYYLFGTNQADVLYRSKGFYCYAEPRPERVDGPLPRFRSGRRLLGRNNFWRPNAMPIGTNTICSRRYAARPTACSARPYSRPTRREDLTGSTAKGASRRRLELARRNAACGPTRTAMDGFLP